MSRLPKRLLSCDSKCKRAQSLSFTGSRVWGLSAAGDRFGGQLILIVTAWLGGGENPSKSTVYPQLYKHERGLPKSDFGTSKTEAIRWTERAGFDFTGKALTEAKRLTFKSFARVAAIYGGFLLAWRQRTSHALGLELPVFRSCFSESVEYILGADFVCGCCSPL